MAVICFITNEFGIYATPGVITGQQLPYYFRAPGIGKTKKQGLLQCINESTANISIMGKAALTT
jgi:hypothetical protein